MTHWMCATCGYYLQGPGPPDKCPMCNGGCTFTDVTCYRPDCGGEKNVDPLLIGRALGRTERAPAYPPANQVSYAPETVTLRELFDGLDARQRDAVRSLGHYETFEKDAVICAEGTEASKLYLVEEGQVSVQSTIWKGVRIPITVVSPGEAFAWSALVPPHRLTATVVASSRTRVLTIDRDPLLEAMQSNARLALTIMQNVARITASRLRNLEIALAGAIHR